MPYFHVSSRPQIVDSTQRSRFSHAGLSELSHSEDKLHDGRVASCNPFQSSLSILTSHIGFSDDCMTVGTGCI